MARVTVFEAAVSKAAPSAAADGVSLRKASGELNPGEGFDDDVEEAILYFFNDAGTGVVSVSFIRAWIYHPKSAKWFPLGNGTAGDKGKLNDGAALNEVSTDLVVHAEMLRGLGAAARFAIETGTITGTTPTWTCYLEPVRR